MDCLFITPQTSLQKKHEMASVELIKKPTAERKFYVYYNEWTGEILSVGTTERRDERAPHIVTYSEDAGRMLKGTRDERQ